MAEVQLTQLRAGRAPAPRADFRGLQSAALNTPSVPSGGGRALCNYTPCQPAKTTAIRHSSPNIKSARRGLDIHTNLPAFCFRWHVLVNNQTNKQKYVWGFSLRQEAKGHFFFFNAWAKILICKPSVKL